jgi:thioredoxin-dependent peroxiredoxin
VTDRPAGHATVGSLRVGDRVPGFLGTTDEGRTVTDAELIGRPAVVYFYPKAGSVGCSIEAREFARHHEEFAAAGVRVIGVSIDSAAEQGRFRKSCSLPFDLLADASGDVSRRFGVQGRWRMARRTTFLLEADGTIREIVRSWRPGVHIRRALAWLSHGKPRADRSTRPGRAE